MGEDDRKDRRVAEWARGVIEEKWPGARPGQLAALQGDASTRRFWRIAIAPASDSPPSAIAVDLGPYDLPLYARELKLYPEPLQEPPWINLHRFLTALGAPVPALYRWSAADRMLLVEDVGALSLLMAARANPAQAADLYRDAVSEVMRFHIDATASANPNCVAFQVAYDERLFGWEMRRFIEFGLAAISPGASASALEAELAAVAHELGALPRVFSHRDYHSNNLFLQEAGRIRIIDFQDALMGPAAQDLAVLLTTRDAGDTVSEALEERLLNFYFSVLLRRVAANLSREEFMRSYWLCVLQHALKCIGLFVFLGREGKQGYGSYVPYAISQARRSLDRLAPDFPNLRRVFTP